MKRPNMIQRVKQMKYSYKIISIHVVMQILVGIIFYPLLPLLLNYPPYIFNYIDVYIKIYGFTYMQYFIAVNLAACLALIVFLKTILSGIDDWEKLKTDSEADISKIQ